MSGSKSIKVIAPLNKEIKTQLITCSLGLNFWSIDQLSNFYTNMHYNSLLFLSLVSDH